jgi:hypothetical protein
VYSVAFTRFVKPSLLSSWISLNAASFALQGQDFFDIRGTLH